MANLPKIVTTLGLLLIPFISFAQRPFLDKSGGAAKMMVQNKPFIMLGAEIHNSTGSDTAGLKKVLKQAKALNMNTILAYAYWEFIEPEEGKFNFWLLDQLLQGARKEKLKVGLVWFGSWKSTTSSYAPAWVKTNPQRFPRHTLADGKTLEILSTFSAANRDADAKAYAALMQHLVAVDKDHTVILLQTENEPGCFQGYRDYSPAALQAWSAEVPAPVVTYLNANKGKLFPSLEKAWANNGYKTKGTWEELFGKSTAEGEYPYYSEELFMAYHYSIYINHIAAQGRKILDLPTFCNGWLYNKRGTYPHGTINPHVLDLYRAGGTALDFYSPNVYTIDYDDLFSKYKTGGNILFIPESLLSPAGVLYAIAEYDAIGFAPFGIDGWNRNDEQVKLNLKLLGEINGSLQQMQGLIGSKYNSPQMRGAYFAPPARNKEIELGDYKIAVGSSADFRFSIDFGKSLEQVGKQVISFAALSGQDDPAPGPNTPPADKPAPPTSPFGGLPKDMGAALIIQNAEDEFYIVGYGVKLNFALKEGVSFNHLGFLSIDEGYFKQDQFIATKRWNGDEQKVSLPGQQLSVLKVKLYRI